MRNPLFAVMLVICMLAAGCGRTQAEPHQPLPEFDISNEHSLPHHHEQDVHNWSYNEQGSWTIACGQMQSPINIDTSDLYPMENGGNLMLYYTSTASYIEDMGHTIQAGLDGAAMINRRAFAPVQVHFHAHSEHTISGETFPLEGHFVHVAQDGRIAVVGVMFIEGEENPGFSAILNAIKAPVGGEVPDVDFNALLPADKSYYHYLGSLTTPPLSENVEWYILRQPVTLSSEQIQGFETFYDHNYRDLQPLNGRNVLVYAP